MEIGIIRPYEIEFNNADVVDIDKAIKTRGHETRMIYADMLGIGISEKGINIGQMLSRSERSKPEVDCAVLRHLGIIKDYEQYWHRVSFVRAMEACGIYVTNPVMQWLNARDKLSTFITLAKSGIPIPETISTEHMFIAYEAVKKFGKAVIKPLLSAMGYGVFKVEDPDVAMHIFSYLVNINKPMYVQKYIEKKGGGDYRVVVVEGRALGAEFRKGSGWKSNIAQGASPINVENPDKELTELAIKATESLGLDFAGIDIAETEEGYCVLESNPTLSWQGFKKATGINPAEEIVDFLIRKAKR